MPFIRRIAIRTAPPGRLAIHPPLLQKNGERHTWKQRVEDHRTIRDVCWRFREGMTIPGGAAGLPPAGLIG